MKYLTEIEKFKEKFLVSEKFAKKLLIESNGDLQQAENLLKQHLLTSFMQKQAVDIEIAVKFLEKSNYDFAAALHYHEEYKYGKIGLCLRKNKNKEKALDDVLCLIVTTQNIPHQYYWEIKSLPQMSKIQRTFVLLMGWLNWESWEGVLMIEREYANEWRNVNAEWFADLFDAVIKRKEELNRTEQQYWEDELYKSFDDTFQKRREELIDKLYSFVNENMTDDRQ